MLNKSRSVVRYDIIMHDIMDVDRYLVQDVIYELSGYVMDIQYFKK